MMRLFNKTKSNEVIKSKKDNIEIVVQANVNLNKAIKTDSVLLLGNSIGTYPTALVTDRDISGDTFKLWAYLRVLANNNVQTPIPKQTDLAKLLGVSRPTLINALHLLKIKRWLMVIPQFENNLRIANIYTIVDNQLSIDYALQIDSEYLKFISNKSKSSNKKIKWVATEVIQSLNPTHKDQLSIIFNEQKRIDNINKAWEKIEKATPHGKKRKEHLIYERLVKSARTKFGELSANTIIKRLKSKEHYYYDNGSPVKFAYNLDYSEMNIILIALISDNPNKITPYINKLILLASQDQLILQSKQAVIYRQIIADIDKENEDIKPQKQEMEFKKSVQKGIKYQVIKKSSIQINDNVVSLDEDEQFLINEFNSFKSLNRVTKFYDLEIANYLLNKNYIKEVV